MDANLIKQLSDQEKDFIVQGRTGYSPSDIRKLAHDLEAQKNVVKEKEAAIGAIQKLVDEKEVVISKLHVQLANLEKSVQEAQSETLRVKGLKEFEASSEKVEELSAAKLKIEELEKQIALMMAVARQ